MRISSLMLWRCAGQAAVLTNPFDCCEPTRCNALVAGRRSDASIAWVRASDHQRAHRRPWSSSWTPSARAVINLSVPAEELGAPRQAEQPAACGWAGFLGLSGSGRMPCVPCVLPRSGTLCSMLVCVGAAVVCHCLCVSSDGVFAVPVVCDRTRAGAAVRCCAWSLRQRSRPMSWWGGSRALWARGVTWSGRIASRVRLTRALSCERCF